jgi:integrase/recombinase XerC
MILGKGCARTEEGIIREYQQFLLQQGYSLKVLDVLRGGPGVMLRRIGKPLIDWEDNEILELLHDRGKQAVFSYCAFLAFLFFRGYRRATINILTQLPTCLSLLHRNSLLPIRQRIEETYQELKYVCNKSVGTNLNRLIWLLAVVGKPLIDITRKDFEAFREEYQAWYGSPDRNMKTKKDKRIARIERFLIHWNILQPVKKIYKHEEYFSSLEHIHIRNAILEYINWYEAKSSRASVNGRRVGVLKFFLWLQEKHPEYERLDEVNRKVALEYAHHLKQKVDLKEYSPNYRNYLYRDVRLMYDFAVFERLDTSPDRNPFGSRDVPKVPDPLPRYIHDHDLRKVLNYCQNGAELKEKTIVTILLHTGIRAVELANLCTTDVVQIQGTWKLPIREGKGLKDRMIPLTPTCLAIIQEWQGVGWEGVNEHLFTWRGQPWSGGTGVCRIVRQMNQKIGITGLSPHRFRHTFAVALLNHGLRESALQKLLGHATLTMTLEYGRILDQTVELSFNQAIENMQEGPLQKVPNFFKPDEYSPFEEADAVNWIRLPHGYCRRHPKMHCESDVKCLLCDRYCAHSENLECLQGMHQRYLELDMPIQADVVNSHIHILENHSESKISTIPQELVSV